MTKKNKIERLAKLACQQRPEDIGRQLEVTRLKIKANIWLM
jgi:hypothetical protein